MALEIYRSSTQQSSSFDRYNELCRYCAKDELKNGFYVEFDGYLSNKEKEAENLNCEKCAGSFFIDGRRKWNELDGAIY